jgi:hypothetical protein
LHDDITTTVLAQELRVYDTGTDAAYLAEEHHLLDRREFL